jgi:hypothetical protein
VRQCVKRLALGVLILGPAVGAAAWVSLTWIFTRPDALETTLAAGPVDLLSWPEHDAIYAKTEFPYLLRLNPPQGELLYIGVQHARDASDPQLAAIESRWAEFRPTVALCEGRARLSRFATRPAQGPFDESTLVRILARQAGVPLYTLEPESEAAGLLAEYDARLVAAYLTLRVFTSEARGATGDLDALALDLLRKRTDVDGLRGAFASLQEFDAYWLAQFPGEPDWRTLRDTESVPLLVAVGDRSRQVRGEHMVAVLAELASRGERVLAVVGASHVIRQEPALRRALEREQAP